MRVKISSEELSVLGRCEFVSPIKIGAASGTAVKDANVVLELTDDEIDDLRDACIERQQVSGFDKDYKLNTLGRVLQGLIDKLFS